jgi:hypothetical protein
VVVESSPGKAHEHIFVDGLSFDDHRAIMETMVEVHGSCSGAKDLCRVLRLPGFYHQKGRPFPVRIIGGRALAPDWRPYGADDVRKAFPPVARKPEPSTPSGAARADVDLAWVKEALEFIPLDPRASWLTVGQALHHAGPNPSGETKELWDLWSEQSEKFDSKDQDRVWESFRPDAKKPITLGTKRWSRFFAQGAKWNFCLTAGKISPRIRRANEEKSAPESLTGFQGEGGTRCDQG